MYNKGHPVSSLLHCQQHQASVVEVIVEVGLLQSRHNVHLIVSPRQYEAFEATALYRLCLAYSLIHHNSLTSNSNENFLILGVTQTTKKDCGLSVLSVSAIEQFDARATICWIVAFTARMIYLLSAVACGVSMVYTSKPSHPLQVLQLIAQPAGIVWVVLFKMPLTTLILQAPYGVLS
jgi:hypothetical protein